MLKTKPGLNKPALGYFFGLAETSHTVLLHETCTRMRALLCHTLATEEEWMLREDVFDEVGAERYGEARDVFWQHIRLLRKQRLLPKLTQKNERGRRVCSVNGQIGTTWCRRCAKGIIIVACTKCLEAVRVVKSRDAQTQLRTRASKWNVRTGCAAPDLESSELERFFGLRVLLIPDVDVMQRFTPLFGLRSKRKRILSSDPQAFRGADFAQQVLPLFLDDGAQTIECSSLSMRQICRREDLTPLAKISALLDLVYPGVRLMRSYQGATEKDQGGIWVASINDQVKHVLPSALGTGLQLNATNSLYDQDATGRYEKIWGCSEREVYKWHMIKTEDFIVFGNTQSGVYTLGEVGRKFVFKPNADVNDLRWTYGFTLAKTYDIWIDPDIYRTMCAGIGTKSLVRIFDKATYFVWLDAIMSQIWRKAQTISGTKRKTIS